MLNSKTVIVGKRINRTDFPRTPWSVSFGLPKALASAFNYARQYPTKMASLKEVLEFMLDQVYMWEDAHKVSIGEYTEPKLEVYPATTNVVETDNTPVKVIRADKEPQRFGERKDPSTPVVPREATRIAPAVKPMTSSKAWQPVSVPPTTVAAEVPAVPGVPSVPQVQTAPTIPSVPPII